MLEKYFEQPEDAVAVDVRKDLSYQVGTTPAFTELPRDHCERSRCSGKGTHRGPSLFPLSFSSGSACV